MSPEALAQWRADAALMREFSRSPEWACLRRHLEALRDDALAQEDVQPPCNADEVMHYRAARQAFGHVLRLPETVVRHAEQVDAGHKAEQSRLRPTRRNDARR